MALKKLLTMKKRPELKYLRPGTNAVKMDLEGVICDSMRFIVTVDELDNKNIPASGQTAPSETLYFEF